MTHFEYIKEKLSIGLQQANHSSAEFNATTKYLVSRNG